MSVRQCVSVCVSFVVCLAFLSLIWATFGLFFYFVFFNFIFIYFSFFFCCYFFYFFSCTFFCIEPIKGSQFISIFSHICTQCSTRSLIYSMHAAAPLSLALALLSVLSPSLAALLSCSSNFLFQLPLLPSLFPRRG